MERDLIATNNRRGPDTIFKDSSGLFFLCLFLFQLLFIFQGLDLADEGFHSTFYQRVFSDPESVEYNFMFWMSGIVGGAWLKLFPSYGLLGLRFGGVLVNMATIFISWRLLKNFIEERNLKIGLLIMVLMNGAAVKDLGYNNLSALFFVTAIYYVFGGLTTKRDYLHFPAGFFLTLATFSRLSNASGLALVLVIVYAGFFSVRRTAAEQIRQIIFFLTGFVIGLLVLLMVMKRIGHYSVFLGNLQLLKEIAVTSENTHGIMNLIKVLTRDYSTAIFKRFLPLAMLVVYCASVINYFRSELLKRGLPYCFSILFIVALIVLIITRGTLVIWVFLILLFSALSLIACCAIIIRKDKNELRILSLSGTIMTLVLVAGSDYGIRASAASALWIAFPIATNFFLTLPGLNFRIPGISPKDIRTAIHITSQQLQTVWNWGIYSCVILLVIHSFVFTYNDNANRMKMNTSVNNAFVKGVFTTPARAASIDELLATVNQYIKPNDYVIAYPDFPMFYALTSTRPYIKNSWIGIYNSRLIKKTLDEAAKSTHLLPPIVYQKEKPSLDAFWLAAPSGHNDDLDLANQKNESIRNFIESNNYKVLWENSAFKIFVPTSNTKPILYR